MQSVNVDIIGDTIGEMDETFTLRLEPVNQNDDGVTVTFTISMTIVSKLHTHM